MSDVFHLWIPGRELGTGEKTLCGLRLDAELLLLAAREGEGRRFGAGVCPRCLTALATPWAEDAAPVPLT